MPDREIEKIELPTRPGQKLREPLWREWCFARVAWQHVRWRLAVLVFILVGGGLAFQHFEPEKQHSLPRAMFYTWALIFGEPPEEFPRAPLLQALFFAIPVIGLLVILEGIVDFALMLRDRRRHERSWCKIMASSLRGHVIIVGLGKLGYRTYRFLRRLGEIAVIIERNPDNQFLEEIRRDGAPIFIGDARREAILGDANAKHAKSIVLATDDDLANLEVALDARRVAPDIRVVLRMFDQNMADKIRYGFDIRLAMSESAISAPRFAMAAIDPSIVNSMVVEDRLVVMQRWKVEQDGPLCGRTIADVMSEYAFGVVERVPASGARRLFPLPNTRLEPGDEVLVQGTFQALTQLRRKPRIEQAEATTTFNAD